MSARAWCRRWGGQAVHPLEFAGAEIMPAVSGSALILQEPNESGETGSGSWVTHPLTMGYRRQGPSGGSIHGTGGGSLIPRQMAHRATGIEPAIHPTGSEVGSD